MWNAQRDMEIWETIAVEAHSRHSRKTSAYVNLQTIVEDRAHKLVADRVRGSARVLEIGVGGGEHLIYRHSETGAQRYTGLDLSPEYAEICRQKFGIEVVCCDAADMPFDEGSFNDVIAISILEHVERLNDTLLSVKRVLAADGKFHVVVPTNGSLAVNAFKLLVTYPTLRRRGIEKPALVWHTLNVNSFKRVKALLSNHFSQVEETGIPSRFVPWWLSPLWVFECKA